MGYPYNELVAPAVLLANPGITREKFAALLDQTHSSSFKEYQQSEAWDYYDARFEDNLYHRGLEGLAHILSLEYSEPYKEFIAPPNPKTDENGLLIHPPRNFSSVPHIGTVEDIVKSRFVVIVHKRNIVEPRMRTTRYSWDRLSIGSIWEEVQLGEEMGIVTKIFTETELNEGEDDMDNGPNWEYNMEIKPFYGEYDTILFETEEDLWEAWPQFHPDNIFDWSQEKGHFSRSEKKFLWLRKEDRYYFDPQTFHQIPAGTNAGGLGYTDLILTAGALRHNAWKILSYRGLEHLQQFLRDFPDVARDYEKAVWDSHTSLHAKRKGMTVTQLLRERL